MAIRVPENAAEGHRGAGVSISRVNPSVTFAAYVCASWRGSTDTNTAGIPGDRICSFIERLKALAALFVQVLKLAEKAGLVKLGHVALDGTKIKANASKHKAMSYERMKKREAELEAEVVRWLVAAEAADAEEDKLYGQKRGDEMPIGWPPSRGGSEDTRGQSRAGGGNQSRRRGRDTVREEAEKKRIAEGRKKNGKSPTPPKQEPEGKTQRNFTDPESRVLLTKDGYIQGYKCRPPSMQKPRSSWRTA